MHAGVHRVKTEVFAPINQEVTFVPVTRSMRDTDARQVCVFVIRKLSYHINAKRLTHFEQDEQYNSYCMAPFRNALPKKQIAETSRFALKSTLTNCLRCSKGCLR